MKRLTDIFIRSDWGPILIIIGYVLLFYLEKMFFAGQFHGFFEFDLYEWLADSFREGHLGIMAEKRGVILWDSTPRGSIYYLTWGPLPALIYLFFDAISQLIANTPFPKVLLLCAIISLNLSSIYLILKELFQQNRLLAFIATISYSATNPFMALIHMDELTAEISVWYASSFFIFALYLWLKDFKLKQITWRYYLSAIFIVFAMQTRVTYVLHTMVFVPLILLHGKNLKPKSIFVSIISLSGFSLLVYNKVRFGSFFDFGEDYGRYHMSWEQTIYGYGLIPQTFSSIFHRLQESFYDFSGIFVGRDALVQKGAYQYDPHTLYSCFDYLHVVTKNPTIILGIFSGFFIWIKDWKKYFFELVLTVLAIFIILFFLTYSQGWMYRYAPPFWPLLIILGFKGIWDLLSKYTKNKKQFLWLFIPLIWLHSITLWPEEWVFSSDNEMTRLRVAPLKERNLVYNVFLNREFELIPYRFSNTIGCDNVQEMLEPPKLPTKLQLGLYKKNNKCTMNFFFGATLPITPKAKCSANLKVDRSEIDSCSKVAIYLDGTEQGVMKNSADKNQTSICRYDLPPMEQEKVIINYHIMQDRYDLKNVYRLPRYSFLEMNVTCNIK